MTHHGVKGLTDVLYVALMVAVVFALVILSEPWNGCDPYIRDDWNEYGGELGSKEAGETK